MHACARCMHVLTEEGCQAAAHDDPLVAAAGRQARAGSGPSFLQDDCSLLLEHTQRLVSHCLDSFRE